MSGGRATGYNVVETEAFANAVKPVPIEVVLRRFSKKVHAGDIQRDGFCWKHRS
jgi:hypothetical protein